MIQKKEKKIEKIKRIFHSVKAKLFITLCATVLCIIIFLIILNSFALEKFYLYSKENTLKDVYTYEPVQEDWNPVYEDLLMGVQASMWTEFCNSPDDVEYQLFPRLLALSDIAWTKKGTKDWPDFLKRIDRS